MNERWIIEFQLAYPDLPHSPRFWPVQETWFLTDPFESVLPTDRPAYSLGGMKPRSLEECLKHTENLRLNEDRHINWRYRNLDTGVILPLDLVS